MASPLKPPPEGRRMTEDTPQQRRTGRPRMAQGEARDDRLPRLRVTAAERAAVEVRAAQAGLELSEFCRRAILGQRVTAQPIRMAQAQLLAEINRIGVNLNQLARAANAGRPMPASVDAAVIEVRAVIERLAEALE